jgi:hypothetical protein
MELLLLLAAPIKVTQGVTLTLFLVVLVATQPHHPFLLVQLTHHQVALPVLHLVDLIVVGGLVKFHLELVDNNTGQEHVPGQTAPHTLKRIPEFAVIRFVALGALGKV